MDDTELWVCDFIAYRPIRIREMASEDRIIVLLDLDCFFCQVESREQPSLMGKPLVVSQNNVVLAVSYEARARGVTRFIRSSEARDQCPEVNIVNSPIAYGKYDNTKYRLAGQEVMEVLKNHCPIIERASIDESYLDITKIVEDRLESRSHSSKDLGISLQSTFVVGYCDQSNCEKSRSEGVQRWLEEAFDDINEDQSRRLALAAALVEDIRKDIFVKTQFTCSAGISYNKVLAKLACGLHKPNKQTILTSSEVSGLFTSIPVNKLRNLGGKIGKTLMEELDCKVMSDLMKFTVQDLTKSFDEKTSNWLFNIARGIDEEPVTHRVLCKSIAASKNFPPKTHIVDPEGLKEWLNELAGDLVERLEHDQLDNQRRATTLTVSYHHLVDKKIIAQSKSCPMGPYKRDRISSLAFDIITKKMQTPIVFISLGSSKFVEVQKTGNFVNYFKKSVNPEPAKSLANLNEGKVQIETESTGVNQNKNEKLQRISKVLKNFFPGNEDNFVKSTESVPNSNETEHLKQDEKHLEKLDDQKTESESNECEHDQIDKTRTIFQTPLGEEETDKENRGLIKLQEIFPNLNDIDHSVLKMLPIELQNEAESYLKTIVEVKSEVPENRESLRNFEDEQQGAKGKTICEKDRLEKVSSSNAGSKNSRSLIKLQELFPNLEEIDQSVLNMLPIELRDEAKFHLKSMNKSHICEDHGSENKSPKVGSSKSNGKEKQGSYLQNFFIRADSSNDTMVRCSECNQMIVEQKFAEHFDFHVAQNLQRDMNKGGEGKHGDPSKRYREKSASPRVSKKTRSIDTYFGKQ